MPAVGSVISVSRRSHTQRRGFGFHDFLFMFKYVIMIGMETRDDELTKESDCIS